VGCIFNVLWLSSLIFLPIISRFTERFNNIENRLDTIKNEVKKVGSRIDGKLIPTTEGLLDG